MAKKKPKWAKFRKWYQETTLINKGILCLYRVYLKDKSREARIPKTSWILWAVSIGHCVVKVCSRALRCVALRSVALRCDVLLYAVKTTQHAATRRNASGLKEVQRTLTEMSCAAWFVCWFVCLSVQQTRKHPLCYYYYYYYYYQLLLHVLRLLSVTESELSGFFFYAFLYNTSIFTTPCHQRSASHTAFLLFVKCFRLLVTSVFFQYLAAYICLFVSDCQCWRLLHVCVLYIILKKN